MKYFRNRKRLIALKLSIEGADKISHATTKDELTLGDAGEREKKGSFSSEACFPAPKTPPDQIAFKNGFS